MTLRAVTAMVSVWTFVAVLLLGSLADFWTTEARTAFAFGITAGALVFVVAGWVLEGRRRG